MILDLAPYESRPGGGRDAWDTPSGAILGLDVFPAVPAVDTIRVSWVRATPGAFAVALTWAATGACWVAMPTNNAKHRRDFEFA